MHRGVSRRIKDDCYICQVESLHCDRQPVLHVPAGVYSSYESAGINLEYLMEKDAMGKATIYLCDQTISPVPHLSVRLAAIKITQSDYREYPE